MSTAIGERISKTRIENVHSIVWYMIDIYSRFSTKSNIDRYFKHIKNYQVQNKAKALWISQWSIYQWTHYYFWVGGIYLCSLAYLLTKRGPNLHFDSWRMFIVLVNVIFRTTSMLFLIVIAVQDCSIFLYLTFFSTYDNITPIFGKKLHSDNFPIIYIVYAYMYITCKFFVLP